MDQARKIYAVTVTRIDVVTVYATDTAAAEVQALRFTKGHMSDGIKHSRSQHCVTHASEVKA